MSLLQKLISFFLEEPRGNGEEYTGELSTPTCPTCDTALITSNIKSLEIKVCNQCNGIWVYKETFSELLKMEPDELDRYFSYTEENLNVRYEYMTVRDLRKCPICPNTMMNIQYDSSSGIWLDHCPANHGIWLDAGEISLVVQYKKILNEHGGKIPGQVIGVTEEFKKEMDQNIGGFKVSPNLPGYDGAH